MYVDNDKKDKEPSLLSKIAIVAGTGFALKKMTRGSAMYDNIDRFIKASSDSVGGALNTISRTRRQDLTYDTLSKTLKDNFLDGNSKYKQIMKDQTPQINLRNSFKGGMNDLQELHNFSSQRRILSKKIEDGITIERAMDRIQRNLEETKRNNIELKKQMEILVAEALNNKGKYFEIDKNINMKISSEAIYERIKDTKFADSQSIIEEALEFAATDDTIKDETYAKTDNFFKKIMEQMKNNIKEEHGKGSKNFEDRVKDNAATVGELITAIDERNVNIVGDIAEEGKDDFVGMLRDLVSEDSDFADVVLDNALIKKREIDNLNTERGSFKITSLSNMKKAQQDLADGFSDTIAGKLFHARTFNNAAEAPTYFHIRKGSYDAVVAKHLGSSSGIVTDDVFKIGKKFYKGTDSNLEHINSLDNAHLISGNHGSLQVLLNKMTGNVVEKKATTRFNEILDIGTTGKKEKSFVKNFIGKFSEDSNWLRKRVGKLSDGNPIVTRSDVVETLDIVDDINNLFNTNMRAPSVKSVENLIGTFKNENARKILSGVINGDNIAETLLDSKNPIRNKNLDLLLRQYEKGDKSASRFMQIGSGNRYKGLNIIKFDELLQREAVKEAIVLETSSYNKDTKEGFKFLNSRINDLNITSKEKKDLKELSAWTLLQDSTATYVKHSRSVVDYKDKADKAGLIKNLLSSNAKDDQADDFLESFKGSISSFVEENSSYFDNISEKDYSLNQAFANNEFVVVNDGVGLKQVADLNKAIMDGAKQIVAGKGTEENITKATLVAYNMINRLTTPLEEFGLGISSNNAKNIIDITKNSVLTRIIPTMAIGTGIAYLDYESRNITGTSMVGALQNAKSQAVLGVKTITGAVGLDNALEASKDYNPISEYLGGEEYKDREEYLEYLENGYDPVRKGRFWSFGSSSEFRGGKISYWRPNALRRAHSNYYDISMYGSSDEKWKHSLLPTLRYPLSPIRALVDPYWLEELNYNERPYPVTGKLFDEGTPWSAPLNATIGELVKPQKKMHQEHLQGTMTDVRTIIAQENKKIMDRATENRIVRIDNAGASNMTFAPDSMPSMSESVYSISKSESGNISGAFRGQDYAESLQSFENMAISPTGAVYGGNMVKGSGVFDWKQSSYNPTFESKGNGGGVGGSSSFGSFLSELSIGLASSGAVGSGEGMILIDNLNQDIINNAEARQDGVIYENGRLATNQSYEYSKMLDNEFYENENITNIGSMNEFVRESFRSIKQTSGIYGFMWDALTNQEQGYRLAQAGEMDTFSRRFWDSSIGGAGGGVMEIARRFFPSTDKSITSLNPIRNTMPLWMPERFLVGNPYDILPDGEARLPGRGYEALNKLHSDEYGRFGAFDRFKILADIAPMSAEYKIWNKIAKDKAKNPEMKEDIAEIEKRAKAQNKEHDFYNYKFLGRDLESQTAVIKEVTNTGEFTITSSDQQFKLAGVKVLNDEEGSSQVHNYLKPGMRVELSYEDNEFRNKDKKGNVDAIVFAGGNSVTKQMFENGAASEDDNKETLADEYFNLSKGNIDKGHIFEAIGHAQVPFFHNKFLRIDSPLESYRKEQVYGSNFSTWDNPIRGFITPAFQNAFAQGPISQAVGLGTFALSEYARTTDWNKHLKVAAHATFALTNPAAFAGGMIGSIPKLGISTGASKYINARTGAAAGAIAGATGYAFANLDNPILSVGNFATAGYLAAKQLKIDKLSTRGGLLKDIGKVLNTDVLEGKHGAIVGAAIGVGLSAIKNSEFSLNSLGERYIPDTTKKKWEIEEYYDRLEYMKYQNLYKIAAKKAKRKEGVDIETQIRKFEYAREENKDEVESLQDQLKKAEKIINEQVREETINSIKGKIASKITQEQLFAGGEYTKSAIAYKKAMDSTIYGLTEHSSVGDVLRAIPKYDRDFFLEFADEKDPKEREKILSHISPYKKRALQVLWREKDIEEVDDNKDFFKDNYMPNAFWSGWRPNIDLENVQMKTIENEGMLLSDFGMYDSSKNSQDYQQAPEIQNIKATGSTLEIKRDVISMLSGINLQGLEVSVESSPDPGINFVTNIIRAETYKLQEKTNEIFGSLL